MLSVQVDEESDGESRESGEVDDDGVCRVIVHQDHVEM